jgi:hypothetical protein
MPFSHASPKQLYNENSNAYGAYQMVVEEMHLKNTLA